VDFFDVVGREVTVVADIGFQVVSVGVRHIEVVLAFRNIVEGKGPGRNAVVGSSMDCLMMRASFWHWPVVVAVASLFQPPFALKVSVMVVAPPVESTSAPVGLPS
jgi:hypothetical protein